MLCLSGQDFENGMVRPSPYQLPMVDFDEYCRFDTSAFFGYIKRASLYIPKETRSIKTAIFIEI